jgi:hypothetical protein
VSRLRTERLRLFHSLTVAETKESLVKDSLQNGTIISLVLVCGINLCFGIKDKSRLCYTVYI